MSLDYSAAIKITFDKEITNDPEVVLTSEILDHRDYSDHTPFASSQYSTSYDPTKAFDLSTGTYWRSLNATMPQWLGTNFLVPKTFVRVRAYLSSYKPANYILQGSSDGVTWYDIISGTFTSTSGWQTIDFSPATYQYWRVYVTTLQSTALYIYELEFYGARLTYDTSGWEVTGYELDMLPGGVAVPETYTVYRVTKTEDNMSVILWLELSDRMRYPQGEVSVRFFGDLRGPGSVSVSGFTESFTPVGITPLFNPNTVERVEISTISAVSALVSIVYSDTNPSVERVEIVSITVVATLTAVIDLP